MNRPTFCLSKLFSNPGKAQPESDLDEETDKRIINAAIKIFDQEGYEGARMQSIAEAAGVNKALLHYHHKNKEQLYLTVLSHNSITFWTSVLSVLEEPDLSGRDFIYKLINKLFEFQITNPTCMSIFMQEMAKGGSNMTKLDESIQSNCDQSVAAIVTRINEYVEKGEFKKMDPIHIFLNIETMVAGTYLFKPMLELSPLFAEQSLGQEFYEQRCQSIAETVCNGILNE